MKSVIFIFCLAALIFYSSCQNSSSNILSDESFENKGTFVFDRNEIDTIQMVDTSSQYFSIVLERRGDTVLYTQTAIAPPNIPLVPGIYVALTEQDSQGVYNLDPNKKYWFIPLSGDSIVEYYNRSNISFHCFCETITPNGGTDCYMMAAGNFRSCWERDCDHCDMIECIDGYSQPFNPSGGVIIQAENLILN